MNSIDGAQPADTRPMFSFLTTAYRSEDTLPRTLESVLAQTWDDWELVLVDNGWSDAIVDAAAPYLDDPRMHLVRQENRGVTGGALAASAAAHGRYLVPLNSDDAVTPDFCARIADTLAADPAIAAVTCDAHQFVDPGEEPLARSYRASAGESGTPDGRVPLQLADVVDGPCPYYSAAIRRDVWDSLGGLKSDLGLVDDLDFWLRAILAGHDIRVIPDRLGRYRVQAGSISRPDSPEQIEAFEAQRETALARAAIASEEPSALAALNRVLRRLRYRQHLRRARTSFRDGDRSMASHHARAAWSQKRTIRVAAVLVGLRLAPGVLAVVQPVKHRWFTRFDRARQRGFRHGGWRHLIR